MGARPFIKHPFIQLVLRSLEQDIKKYGFHGAAKIILDRTRWRHEVIGMDNLLRRALSDGPVVVVANHPTSAAVFALIAALSPRDDIRLVISSKFFGGSDIFDRFLIPVYIRHHLADQQNELLNFLLGTYNIGMTPEQEHAKNRRSVSVAATHVENGGVVVLFPGYPDHDEKGWHRGIGHLLVQVKRTDVQIVVAHIDEAAWTEYLRFIPFLGRLLPKLGIRFARPLSRHVFDGLDARDITTKLEKEYTQLRFTFPA